MNGPHAIAPAHVLMSATILGTLCNIFSFSLPLFSPTFRKLFNLLLSFSLYFFTPLSLLLWHVLLSNRDLQTHIHTFFPFPFSFSFRLLSSNFALSPHHFLSILLPSLPLPILLLFLLYRAFHRFGYKYRAFHQFGQAKFPIMEVRFYARAKFQNCPSSL